VLKQQQEHSRMLAATFLRCSASISQLAFVSPPFDIFSHNFPASLLKLRRKTVAWSMLSEEQPEEPDFRAAKTCLAAVSFSLCVFGSCFSQAANNAKMTLLVSMEACTSPTFLMLRHCNEETPTKSHKMLCSCSSTSEGVEKFRFPALGPEEGKIASFPIGT
jgi:hypothetical protein